MFLCLSSGASPRYRQDVLRALSMPHGSLLQFRYHRNWIAKGILQSPQFSRDRESLALIAYIDQSDPKKTPELVPCRFASIVEAKVHGTTVSLLLELKEFALAADLAGFNKELQATSAGSLPAWQADGKLKGEYWLELAPNPATSIRSEKLEDWESIVAQLVQRADFKDETCFYAVQGI